MSIRTTVLITATAEGREALLDVLRTDTAAASKEPGVDRFELYIHPDDPLKFVLLEEWASREALDEHMAHDHTQAVVRALRDDSIVASMEAWQVPATDRAAASP